MKAILLITIYLYKPYRKKEPFWEWFDQLEIDDQDIISERLYRVMDGNFGHHRRISKDIWELKFIESPGFRIYFSFTKRGIILIISAGNKKTQDKDIKKVEEQFEDYMEDPNGKRSEFSQRHARKIKKPRV